MFKKAIILITAVLIGTGISATALAAPNVTGTSQSTLSHNDTVTITGSGFGTKISGQAEPIRFDDFEESGINLGQYVEDAVGQGLQAGSGWWQREPYATAGISEARYDNMADLDRDTISTRNGSAKHIRSHLYGWNHPDFPSEGNGPFYASNVGFANTRKVYVNLWAYVDFISGDCNGAIGCQLKFIWITPVGGEAGHNGYPAWNIALWTWDQSTVANWYTQVIGKNVNWIKPAPNPSYATEGYWINIAIEYKESSGGGVADGGGYMWYSRPSSTKMAYYKGGKTGIDTQNSGDINTVSLGYYWTAGGLEANTYWDDIYIDNSWARVEIGDNPVYDDATHREIQYPTAWTDSSITVTAKQGSFPDGSDVYLFVVDEDGTASTGYPITFGQAGPADTTPPDVDPANLLATAISESQIDLSWTAASDSDSSISSYKIYKDTVLIDTISGALLTYSDTGLLENTLYSYEVTAVSAGGESNPSNSSSATTFADTTRPAIQSAAAIGRNTVEVLFSESVEQTSAENIGNYSIDNAITISTASLNIDTVTLTVSTLSEGITYTLTVNNVRDRAGTPNIILPDSQAAFTYTGGLLAHWKFDEGSGVTASDATGNNPDASVNGAVWTTGLIDGALSFNGTSDYVNLPKDNLTAGQSEVTLAMWVKPDVWEPGRTIYDEYADGVYWQFSVNEDYWYTRDASTGTTGTRDNDLSLPTIPTGEWHHLAFVYNVNQNKKEIYYDGVLNNSTSVSIDILTTSRDGVKIGDGASGLQYSGLIDDVRIYNRALTAQEIAGLANVPPPADTTPPIIAITGPADGLTTNNAQLTVTGTSFDVSGVTAVTVNGVSAATTDSYATWTADITLSEGSNPITVTAIDGAANPGSAGISVTLDTTPPDAPVNLQVQ